VLGDAAVSLKRQKFAIFVLLAGVAALLLLLAASLSQIKLASGQPFVIPDLSLFDPYPQGTPAWLDLLWLIVRGFVAVSVILTPFGLIYMLFSKRGRKELALLLANMLVILLLFMALHQTVTQEAPAQTTAPESFVETIGEEGEAAQLPEAVAHPPEWTTWITSLTIAAVLAALSIAFVRLLLRRRKSAIALERLAEEAQDALDRLEKGEDLRETILRCYREMIQAVRETRGIVREQSVTPREFESLLKEKGLPSESLLRLTRLFEETRYGSHPASSQEEQLAILCLRDIVAACGGGKPDEA
jgi:hypothetical protein